MAVLEPTKSGYYLWRYLPSIPAAVVFMILFLAMTALVSWRMFKTKTLFSIPFAIGGVFEFAGYLTRIFAHDQTGHVAPYAIQNSFILLGPALFAASIYMCLSRIVRGVRGDKYTLVKPSRLTKTFVAGDVLSFVVQGGAVGLMVSKDNTNTGEYMVIGGLLIQVVMFAFFGITAVFFQKRIGQNPTPESCNSTLPWKKSMRMLYVVSILIMIRSVYRVVGYAMGNDGYLLAHEWTLYVFDAAMMFAVMVVYFIWYPTWITSERVELESFSV